MDAKQWIHRVTKLRRNWNILEMRIINGAPFKLIGNRHDITKQRAQAIYKSMQRMVINRIARQKRISKNLL